MSRDNSKWHRSSVKETVRYFPVKYMLSSLLAITVRMLFEDVTLNMLNATEAEVDVESLTEVKLEDFDSSSEVVSS